MDWARLRAAASRHIAGKITVVDVGARWGIGERWLPIADLVQVFGFDPDRSECERLNSHAPGNVRYVPIALGEFDGDAMLHITAEPACSSLYPPLTDVSELLPESACTTPQRTECIRVASFDTWKDENGVGAVSCMKLDTQGSELGVLRGAESALADVQLLEVEVEFNPIYAGQPLFGDVDSYLRARGFVLWHLSHLVHYSNRELPGLRVRMPDVCYFDSQPVHWERGAGQLFWAHAYFTRAEYSPASYERVSAAKALRAALVAAAFGLHDLAQLAVQKAEGELDPSTARELMVAIAGAGTPG